MKDISRAELKKPILAVEAGQLKHPAAFPPDRAQRATLHKRRLAAEAMPDRGSWTDGWDPSRPKRRGCDGREATPAPAVRRLGITPLKVRLQLGQPARRSRSRGPIRV